MARFAGHIGYIKQVETKTDVFEPVEIPKFMKGDVLHLTTHNRDGGKINDDVSLNHRISIVADEYAYENFQHLKWVEYLNVKWKISSVEVQRPRLLISLGGVYNG